MVGTKRYRRGFRISVLLGCSAVATFSLPLKNPQVIKIQQVRDVATAPRAIPIRMSQRSLLPAPSHRNVICRSSTVDGICIPQTIIRVLDRHVSDNNAILIFFLVWVNRLYYWFNISEKFQAFVEFYTTNYSYCSIYHLYQWRPGIQSFKYPIGGMATLCICNHYTLPVFQ